MRIKRTLYLVGKILLIVAGCMLLPLLVALIYKDGDAAAFMQTIPIVAGCGAALMLGCRNARFQPFRQRESFFLVGFSWILISLLGALPYIFSGVFVNFADALFESASGFTTTGASVMTKIEGTPRGILFYRSMSQWLGGAGIVLLFIALLQKTSNRGEETNMYKAEYSGGVLAERVEARISDNAKVIAGVYLALTVACVLLLRLGGMDMYESLVHSFSTISTGGFSTRDLSIGAFDSAYIEWVVTAFMFLSGVNLALFYMLFVRNRRRHALANEELRVYTLLMLALTLVISVFLIREDYYAGASVGYVIRKAAFQTISITTTAGFCSDNYDLWPLFPRFILYLLLFVGGCSGSTASGVKISRWIIGLKATYSELSTLFHPQMYRRVYYNRKLLSATTVRNVMYFFFMYMTLALIGALALAAGDLTVAEAFASSLACLGNVGPAMHLIGPAGNYAHIPEVGKYILSFLMLAGRLEVYTMLVLFVPGIWKD
ncbi:MAG: TrkH family potassium uptake protein [Bacillota bacterium]|nr:TrkH family potassium uptake protein [Bacillota bacterium]